MADFDLFTGDGFTEVQLSEALENVPTVPSWLTDLELFEEMPISTKAVAIEERNDVLTLVQTSPRGAPLNQRVNEKRDVRYFPTVRIAQGDRLEASEIQDIRAFGTTSELENMQTEVLRRLTSVRTNVQLTHEYHMLGAVQGIVLDADGTTTIRNWFTEWAITQATEITFAMTAVNADSDGSTRTACSQVIRATARAAKGSWIAGRSYVCGLCSDTFFDKLIASSEVRQTYLNQQEAQQLRGPAAFQSVNYGGILFINYQGTDDNSTIAVPAGKVKFFPVNAPKVFKVARSPGESFDMANRPGQPYYAMQIPDLQRNAYVDLEVYSYPLYICTKPAMLQRGTI